MAECGPSLDPVLRLAGVLYHRPEALVGRWERRVAGDPALGGAGLAGGPALRGKMR